MKILSSLDTNMQNKYVVSQQLVTYENSLSEISSRYSAEGADPGHGDKSTVHSYIEEYERLLAPYRSCECFMEIGIAMGLSVAMWREYFDPQTTIVGVDLSIQFDYSKFAGKNVVLIECDATKPEFADRLTTRKFDVVIDDGSHWIQDQVATFNMLRERMNPGGIYIVEDILDLNGSRQQLESLGPCDIIDMRANKGRFDDVLAVYRF